MVVESTARQALKRTYRNLPSKNIYVVLRNFTLECLKSHISKNHDEQVVSTVLLGGKGGGDVFSIILVVLSDSLLYILVRGNSLYNYSHLNYLKLNVIFYRCNIFSLCCSCLCLFQFVNFSDIGLGLYHYHVSGLALIPCTSVKI